MPIAKQYELQIVLESYKEQQYIKEQYKSKDFLEKYYSSILYFNSNKLKSKTNNWPFISINHPVNVFYTEGKLVKTKSVVIEDAKISSTQVINIFNQTNNTVMPILQKEITILNKNQKNKFISFIHLFLLCSLVFFIVIAYCVFVKKRSLFVINDPTIGARKKDFFDNCELDSSGKIPNYSVVYI